MSQLGELYRQCAERCIAEGVVLSERPDGPVHRWVKRNVKHREDTAFFIVLGICCEMNDLMRTPKPKPYCEGQMEFPFLPEVEYERQTIQRIKSYWR
jgi:hypothetical protein